MPRLVASRERASSAGTTSGCTSAHRQLRPQVRGGAGKGGAREQRPFHLEPHGGSRGQAEKTERVFGMVWERVGEWEEEGSKYTKKR